MSGEIKVEELRPEQIYAKFWEVSEDGEEIALCSTEENAERVAALLRKEQK